jgi:hypothetical protein
MFSISEQQFPYKIECLEGTNPGDHHHEHYIECYRHSHMALHCDNITFNSHTGLCHSSCDTSAESVHKVIPDRTDSLQDLKRTLQRSPMYAHTYLLVYWHCTTCVLPLYYMRTATVLHAYCHCTTLYYHVLHVYCLSVLPILPICRFQLKWQNRILPFCLEHIL